MMERFCMLFTPEKASLLFTEMDVDGNVLGSRMDRTSRGQFVFCQRHLNAVEDARQHAYLMHGQKECRFCVARMQKCECSDVMRARAEIDFHELFTDASENLWDRFRNVLLQTSEERYMAIGEEYEAEKDSKWFRTYSESQEVSFQYDEILKDSPQLEAAERTLRKQWERRQKATDGVDAPQLHEEANAAQ